MLYSNASRNNFQQHGKMASNTSNTNGEQTFWRVLILLGLTYLIWNQGGNASSSEDKEQASFMGISSLFSSDKPTYATLELEEASRRRYSCIIDQGFARRMGVSASQVQSDRQATEEYIKRFAPVAVAEMRKYGVPASITLAQAILESDAGNSGLAKQANNHFGLKCFSKNCKKGHCVNYSDDTHKDFFLSFGTVWGSFRAHSEFLREHERYFGLFELDRKDYKAWAQGLAEAGYATDPQYADKLIVLIKNLGLDRYDK